MSALGDEGEGGAARPSERDILERAWSRDWYFAREVLPARVEELLRLLPAARTYGITAPLENFLKRHTGEVLSIHIDASVGPERRDDTLRWTQKLISACSPPSPSGEQFCIPALPEPYMGWLQGASLMRGLSPSGESPLYGAWKNQYMDDRFAWLGFTRARALLEKLQSPPVRPPDFSGALRRFRAYLRLTLPKKTRIPTARQLEQIADEHLGPHFEEYRAFLAPIAERDGAVFTWEARYG